MKKVKYTYNEITYLTRQFYRIQEHRIAFGGQIRALKEQKVDTGLLSDYYDRLFDIEKEMNKYIAKSVKGELIWTEFLKKVKGIGPLFAAGLISLIDIKKAKHISSLWKFAGLDVVDGKASRLRRGHKATWSPLMKQLCWRIGKQFVISGSPYRKYYDARKEFDTNKHPDLKKIHIDNRARRYMVKRFLSDLWLEWRKLEGLPTSKPYVCDKLGHTFEETIIK